MPRRPRASFGNMALHVLNRGVRRMTLLEGDADYAAFERVLCQAVQRTPDVRLLSYILMPNHWHLIVWPRHDDDLPNFMQWLTLTHTQRWHAHRSTVGTGPIYQGRYKCFPVQHDRHFLTVCRYCDLNAKRARLVRRAEQWRWSSLWRRIHQMDDLPPFLSEWPIACPADWCEFLNQHQSQKELAVIRRSVQTGVPFGERSWQRDHLRRMGYSVEPKPRGRPRMASAQK